MSSYCLDRSPYSQHQGTRDVPPDRTEQQLAEMLANKLVGWWPLDDDSTPLRDDEVHPYYVPDIAIENRARDIGPFAQHGFYQGNSEHCHVPTASIFPPSQEAKPDQDYAYANNGGKPVISSGDLIGDSSSVQVPTEAFGFGNLGWDWSTVAPNYLSVQSLANCDFTVEAYVRLLEPLQTTYDGLFWTAQGVVSASLGDIEGHGWGILMLPAGLDGGVGFINYAQSFEPGYYKPAFFVAHDSGPQFITAGHVDPGRWTKIRAGYSYANGTMTIVVNNSIRNTMHIGHETWGPERLQFGTMETFSNLFSFPIQAKAQIANVRIWAKLFEETGCNIQGRVPPPGGPVGGPKGSSRTRGRGDIACRD